MANLSFAIDVGSEIITPIVNYLGAKSTSLVGLGRWVLAACLVAELLVELYAYFIGGGLQILLQRLFRLAMVFSIPLAALMGWGAFAGAIAGFGVNDMASALGGSASPAEAATKIVKAFEAAHKQMIDALMGKPISATAWWEVVTSLLPQLIGLIVGLLFLALFVITSIVFLLALLLGLYMPLIALKLGIIFGPVLVATWAFSPLAGFARAWLSYMLSQAFSYAVAIVLASAAANVASGIFGRFAALKIEGFSDVMALAVGILVVSLGNLFLAYLLIRSDNIASAMVGGPNPGAGAEYLGTKVAGAVAGAIKGAIGGGREKGGDKKSDKSASGFSSTGSQTPTVSAGPSTASAGAGTSAGTSAGAGTGAGAGASAGAGAGAGSGAGTSAGAGAGVGAGAGAGAGVGTGVGGGTSAGAGAGASAGAGTGASAGAGGGAIARRLTTAAAQKLQSIDGAAIAKSVAKSAAKVAAVAAIGSAAGPGVIGAGAAALVMLRSKNKR